MPAYEVARSTTIQAPPERVRGLVEDFHAWRAWSPWEDLDADMRRDYGGPAAGIGARYAWEGNRRAGKGSMEIVGSQPQHVELRLRFEKPFKADNDVGFDLEPAGDGATHVTWRMRGENRGVAGVIARVLRMERLIGRDFEKGLARLKAAAERA